jgi:hypothetical protein
VLALSVSRTGDKRPKDSGGANLHYKHASKSRAWKPASKSSFIQHRNDDYSNDLQKFEKGKRGGEMLFPLFPFSNLFYLFLIFPMQR